MEKDCKKSSDFIIKDYICNGSNKVKLKRLLMTHLTKRLYFTTTTVVDWIDIFSRPRYRYVIIESLDYCRQHKGLHIYAWVLMTNHLHIVAGTEEGQSISDILRDFKKFTNKKIIEILEQDERESRRDWMLEHFLSAGAAGSHNQKYRFWQDGNHVEEIYTLKFLSQKIDYVHNNPVKAEFVARAEDYLYSSAPNYAGDKGLLDVEVVTL